MQLSICYPTTLATGRRKGKMMPLVALGTLPPKIQHLKPPSGRGSAWKTLAPQVSISESYREMKTKVIEWKVVYDLSASRYYWSPGQGSLVMGWKQSFLHHSQPLIKDLGKVWFIDHVFPTSMYFLLSIRKHPYRWHTAKLEVSDTYFCSH